MEGFTRLSAALQTERARPHPRFRARTTWARAPAIRWWRDILEWGQDSDFREHFDIDWSAPKLLVPALGEPYGEALHEGRFWLASTIATGGISFTYERSRLPLTPPSYARILARIEPEPFRSSGAALRRGATRRTAAAEGGAGGARARCRVVRAAIDEAIAAICRRSRRAARAARGAGLARAHWRAAREGLTYRRFFEIADLVGVRVERQRVFDDVHALLLELVADGHVEACGSTTSTGSPTRSAICSACRTRSAEAAALSAGREDPRARRGAAAGPGRSPAPPATSSSQRSPALFVDRAGEPALNDAYEKLSRRPGRLSRRWCARPSGACCCATSPASWSS